MIYKILDNRTARTILFRRGEHNDYEIKRLSVKYRNGREKYTDGKTDFIKDIIMRARKELKNKPYF